MKPADKIKNAVKKMHFKAGPEIDQRLWAEASRAHEESRKVRLAQAKPEIWRTIMKTKAIKITTAAAIIAITAVSIVYLGELTTTTYAVTQTIEANKELRYIHVKNVPFVEHEPQDSWLEFDETGEPIRMRVEEGQNETFRIMVWANDTIKWYSPPKREFVILHETDVKTEIQRAKESIDPKFAVQSLYDLHLEGNMDITVETPTAEGNPIKLIATDKRQLGTLPPNSLRYILLIDPKSKLAMQREQYILENGQYQLRRLQLYLEYNKPISPEMFELQPPEDVKLEDRTQGIGLPQGSMTDSEVAAEVVRQYIEALIARDYEKAGNLYNGKPADELRERVEEKLKIKYLRFIAVGEPLPMPERGPRTFGVPFACIIETSDGKREISGPFGGLDSDSVTEANLDVNSCRQAQVRPVVGQPDRWVITGGI